MFRIICYNLTNSNCHLYIQYSTKSFIALNRVTIHCAFFVTPFEKMIIYNQNKSKRYNVSFIISMSKMKEGGTMTCIKALINLERFSMNREGFFFNLSQLL